MWLSYSGLSRATEASSTVASIIVVSSSTAHVATHSGLHSVVVATAVTSLVIVILIVFSMHIN